MENDKGVWPRPCAIRSNGSAVTAQLNAGTLCVVTSGDDVAPGVSAGHVVRFIRAPVPGTAVAVFQYAPGEYAFSSTDGQWVGKDNAHFCCLIDRTRLRLPEPSESARLGLSAELPVRKLLYRVVPHNGGVVFATPERATLIAKIHTAINASKTWGQFRFAIPRDEYSGIVRSLEDDDEPPPLSTDAFSGESLPGWSDGDYPPWLQAEMQSFLPTLVLEQFGKLQSTHLNGNFWLIPEENLPGIRSALEALGWEIDCAQELPFH